MQTFLPYPDLVRSAEVLDDRRLGKQRVETLQILRALHCEGYGWSNHPAVTMWRGHTPALVGYGMAIVDEWVGRGYGDTTRANIAEFVHPDVPATEAELRALGLLPPWFGREDLHRSHRAALLRKDQAYYGARFDDDPPPDLDYVWPDPPAPPREPGTHSAWVVRGERDPEGISITAAPDERSWVPLDARSGRTTKRMRQLARFLEEMEPGERIVAPAGDRLHVGTVTGGPVPGDGTYRRPVRWVGTLARRELAFPAALQDPQSVFVLRDEPVVQTASSGSR